jgi:hypothetical protein
MISTDDFFIELINGSENDKSNNYQENYLVDESNHIMKNFKFSKPGFDKPGFDKPGAFAHNEEISSSLEFNSKSISSIGDGYLEQLFCSEEKDKTGFDKPGAFAHIHNSKCNHEEISSSVEFKTKSLDSDDESINSKSIDSDDESISSFGDEYLEQLFCSEEKGYILFLLLLLLFLLNVLNQIKYYFKKMSIIMILLEERRLKKSSMKSSINLMCAKENMIF